MPNASDEVTCPKCGGRTWDNRTTKRNPRMPDYKCRDRSCDGVIWPPRESKQQRAVPAPAAPPVDQESLITEYVKVVGALGSRLVKVSADWPDEAKFTSADIQAASATVFITRHRGQR